MTLLSENNRPDVTGTGRTLTGPLADCLQSGFRPRSPGPGAPLPSVRYLARPALTITLLHRPLKWRGWVREREGTSLSIAWAATESGDSHLCWDDSMVQKNQNNFFLKASLNFNISIHRMIYYKFTTRSIDFWSFLSLARCLELLGRFAHLSSSLMLIIIIIIRFIISTIDPKRQS